MRLTRKDIDATVLTIVVVLTFAASHQGWDVPLVGASHRWAAAAIFLLGMLTCGLGTRVPGRTPIVFPLLGTLALVLAGLAIATGSLTPLSLLVADIVALWALSTLRHARQAPGRPVSA
jgi:hypothetical protein